MPRAERAITALAAHSQQLETRIDRLDSLVSGLAEAAVDAATSDELHAVRLHSARVAADLARLTLEMRSEIARIGEQLPPPPERMNRLLVLAEQIADLSDGFDTVPDDLAS